MNNIKGIQFLLEAIQQQPQQEETPAPAPQEEPPLTNSEIRDVISTELADGSKNAQADNQIIKQAAGVNNIEESIIATRNAYINNEFEKTNVKSNIPNAGDPSIVAKKQVQDLQDVSQSGSSQAAGLLPGHRESIKHVTESFTIDKRRILEELTMGKYRGPKDFGNVSPTPKTLPASKIEAIAEKNAYLKDPEKVPSAYQMLKENPTHVAKPGIKVLRDALGQTNQNGEGVV